VEMLMLMQAWQAIECWSRNWIFDSVLRSFLEPIEDHVRQLDFNTLNLEMKIKNHFLGNS